MRRRGRLIVGFFRWIIFSALLWAVLLTVLVAILVQPTFKRYPETRHAVAPERLREHIYALALDYAPRNYRQLWNLNASARYISDQFEKAGARVAEQTYRVEGNSDSAETVRNNTYRNLIASFGPENGSRIIVGAHYDVYGETPGADDNASGVSGLIEMAYLLGRTDLKHRVDVVAYTLAEPPFFRTPDMGSARHAAGLRSNNVDVEGMICLKMIGYFNDEEGSQHFPYSFLNLFYPNRGNYIGVMGGFKDRKLIRQVKGAMQGATDLPVHALCAPRNFAGLDLSDHSNYWDNGYTSVMITDTALYRKRNYQEASDSPETLDYERMSKVVLGVYEAVVRMANEDD